MKKTLALLLCLLMISLSLYVVVFAQVNKEKANVIITENAVYGDRKYAEHVDLGIKMYYCENLLWDIDYSVGDQKTETEFSFYKDRIKKEYIENKQFSMYTHLHYNSTGDIKESTGLGEAYAKLMKNATPYVETTAIIRLKDYIDYYPVYFDAGFPGKRYMDSSMFGFEADTKAKKISDELNEFFKFPVADDHMLAISLQVDKNQNIIHHGTTTSNGESQLENFSLYGSSVVTKKECLIFFSNRTYSGKIMDTSEIPGGYGIFRLPYSESENDISFDTKELKNIFPVDEREEIQQLELSKNRKELYMISKKDNLSYLTVIDAENYKEKSKAVISEIEGEYASFGYIGEDFIVINFYHENTFETFSVYTPDGNGGFEKQFKLENFVEADESNSDNPLYYGGSVHPNSTFDVKWDGELLYVSNTTNKYDTPINIEGFSLSVYDKDGLKFFVDCTTSLSMGYDGFQNSRYHTYISGDELLEIKL